MPKKTVKAPEPLHVWGDGDTTPAHIWGEGRTEVPVSKITHAAQSVDEGQLIALRHGDRRHIPVLLPQFDKYVVVEWIPA